MILDLDLIGLLVVISLVLDLLIVISLVLGLLVITGVVTGRVGDVHLGVDDIVALDVALAGQGNSPVGLGVVVLADLLLAKVVVIIVLNHPVDAVVRDVGVIDVLPAVRVSGGNGGEGEENDSDLLNILLEPNNE